MLAPNGKPANKMDKIMLLSLWTEQLQQERQESLILHKPFIITAGIGKPTFPINANAAKAAMEYWKKIWQASQQARYILTFNSHYANTIEGHEDIVATHAVINYNHPQGSLEAREKMASALSQWYQHKITIKSNHILFTVGGAGALYNIFKFLQQRNPTGKIITPFPYYSLYGALGKNRLHPITVMQEKGYRLTARALLKSIEEVKEIDNKGEKGITAFLFCDPNNPLGTCIGETWHELAEILNKIPHVPIILDEAYAEMRLDGKKHVSLLTIAPELADRIILMRSATKALSAAGERMGVAVTLNDEFMTRLLESNIDICGHAPISLQIAFAEAMDRLDTNEIANLIGFYKPQVEYATKRTKTMGISLPDPSYKVEGTFYVLINLSEFFGINLPEETARALGKYGRIETDEDIAYYLLFTESVMIAPLSYYGLDEKLGYLRITCSGGEAEIKELLNRIEKQLNHIRSLNKKSIYQRTF